jgi:hypothetical protein
VGLRRDRPSRARRSRGRPRYDVRDGRAKISSLPSGGPRPHHIRSPRKGPARVARDAIDSPLSARLEATREYHFIMASAPEHADTLLALAAQLPPERLDKLALKWLDRCVRVHASAALERIGRSTDASALLSLAPLSDRASWQTARSTVLRATVPLGGGGASETEMGTMAGLFGLAVTLDEYLAEQAPQFKSVIVGVVTSARCMGAWHEEREQLAELTLIVR